MIDHGIIYWNSRLSKERQEELSAWYRGLSPEDRKKVDDIRSEGHADGCYDSQDDI